VLKSLIVLLVRPTPSGSTKSGFGSELIVKARPVNRKLAFCVGWS